MVNILFQVKKNAQQSSSNLPVSNLKLAKKTDPKIPTNNQLLRWPTTVWLCTSTLYFSFLSCN